MTQKTFIERLSQAVRQPGIRIKWENVTLEISIVAHIHKEGYVHHVTIDSIFWEGEFIPQDFIRKVNAPLMKEIEAFAKTKAEQKFDYADIEND